MPRRRCVGCGRIAPKPDLLRIALADRGGASPRAVIDREGTMPGRGAYLCREQSGRPAAACAARAGRNRGLARALRATVGIDTELLESVG